MMHRDDRARARLRIRLRILSLAAAAFVLCGTHSTPSAASSPSITLEIADYLTMPITGLVDGKGQTDGLLARVNALREEPGGANRFFITDLNGPIYVLDKDTKKFTTYLDFNGHEGHRGLFHKLFLDAGYGSGLNA